MASAKRVATYADLEALPEHVVGELVDDELFVSPRPRSRHALATGALHGELIGPFSRGRGGPGGWCILIEPELHLGRDVMVPDMAGWRRERMPEVPDVPYFTLPPDWVCEVLSPSTARLDRTRKLPKYAAAGIDHGWIVDPVLRTLEVLRREGSLWLLASAHAADDVPNAEPFAAIGLELAALWLVEPAAQPVAEGP